MQPGDVLAAWPAARFVARAHLTAQPSGAVAVPEGSAYETWGILIDAPDAEVVGEQRGVVTDDGRALTATVPPANAGDAAAVLAAAKYWELPPPYVERLARAAAVPVEEYFY